MFVVNQLEHLAIAQIDLSQILVVRMIVDFCLSWSEHVQQEGGAGGQLAQKFGIWLFADGDPVRKCWSMRRPGFHAFGGPFHMQMNQWNCWTALFFPSVLMPIFSMWRSLGALEFISGHCSDPTQIENESRQLLCACLTWVAAHLREASGGREPSAEQVVAHLHARAHECFPAFSLLQALLHLNIILQLSVIEETNDWESMKLLYPVLSLFACIGNSTNYMVIIGMEILRWLTASPAMNVFFAVFAFTKRTAHGFSIFVDKFVEKTVNRVRVPTGKKHRAGVEDKLAYLVRFLPDIVQQWATQTDAGLPQKRKHREEARQVKVQDAFFLTYQYLNKTNILGALGSDFCTTPRNNKVGLKDRRLEHHAPGTLLDATGEVPNIDWVHKMHTAGSRQTTLHEHLMREDPKGDFESFTPSATATGAASQEYQRWVRKYSTDAADLTQVDPNTANSRIMKHEEVVAELLAWHETLASDWTQASKPTKGMGSDAAAIMLAAVRAQVHALHGVSVPEEPTGSAATIDAGAFVAAVQRALGHPLMTRP